MAIFKIDSKRAFSTDNMEPDRVSADIDGVDETLTIVGGYDEIAGWRAKQKVGPRVIKGSALAAFCAALASGIRSYPKLTITMSTDADGAEKPLTTCEDEPKGVHHMGPNNIVGIPWSTLARVLGQYGSAPKGVCLASNNALKAEGHDGQKIGSVEAIVKITLPDEKKGTPGRVKLDTVIPPRGIGIILARLGLRVGSKGIHGQRLFIPGALDALGQALLTARVPLLIGEKAHDTVGEYTNLRAAIKYGDAMRATLKAGAGMDKDRRVYMDREAVECIRGNLDANGKAPGSPKEIWLHGTAPAALDATEDNAGAEPEETGKEDNSTAEGPAAPVEEPGLRTGTGG